MSLQILEESTALLKVQDESGNEFWMKRERYSPAGIRSVGSSGEKTVANGLLDIIRASQKPVFTGYAFPEALEVLKTLRDKGFNITSLGTLSGVASSLHKKGLIAYASGEKNSGWIAA